MAGGSARSQPDQSPHKGVLKSTLQSDVGGLAGRGFSRGLRIEQVLNGLMKLALARGGLGRLRSREGLALKPVTFSIEDLEIEALRWDVRVVCRFQLFDQLPNAAADSPQLSFPAPLLSELAIT